MHVICIYFIKNKKFVTVLAHIHMDNDNNNSYKPNSHSWTQIFPAFQLLFFLKNTFSIRVVNWRNLYWR